MSWKAGRTDEPRLAASLPAGRDVRGADGAIMGPVETSERVGLALQYNEYIVYHTDQVRMRYLVRVRFDFKGR